MREIPVSVGDKVNYAIHEGKEIVTDDRYEDGVVVDVIYKGYIDSNNENVLRYAGVSVNKKG